MKIEEAIQRFGDYIAVERRLAASTVNYYVGDVRRFADFVAAQQIFDIEDITPREVRAWQMLLVESGSKPGSVIRKNASLRTWFKYLRQQNYLDRDIMTKVSVPRRQRHLPIFFRESEVEHIYDEGLFPDTFDGQLAKVVLRMLYETGVRRAELSGLLLQNVNLSARSLKVRGKRNKERVIPIEDELAQTLSRYIEARTQLLDELRCANPQLLPTQRLLVNSRGREVSVGMIYTIVQRHMQTLSRAERTSPHVFRHTFATHMLNEGANINAIKELLGHSSLTSTEIYTHVSREHLKETYKHAHPRAIKK